jgi:hypothetical protein
MEGLDGLPGEMKIGTTGMLRMPGARLRLGFFR